MGRVSTLIAARADLAPRGTDEDCSGLPTLDPRLCLIYQPHRSSRPPADDPLRLLLASIKRVWPVLDEGALGAGSVANLDDPQGVGPFVAPGPLAQLLGGPGSGDVPLLVPGPLGQLLGCPVLALLLAAGGASGPAAAMGSVLAWLLAAAADPGLRGPGRAAPLGLSEAQSPQNGPKRHGCRGLSANGARQIQRACAVLQDVRPCLAFWTVTLPDETLKLIVARDLWPQFQTRIRDLLVRALKRQGLPARVVGVVELHPGRSMRESIPLPHMHVVFQGRRSFRKRWALGVAALDRIIADAVRYIGLEAPDTKAAGNVQPVRKNCGAYLAKYCTKNRDSRWLEKVPGNLPRVWWFWSAPLRVEVLGLVIRVCWSFVSWLHRLDAAGLSQIGAVRAHLELSDPRAPSTWCVRWKRDDGLRRAADIWKRNEASLLLAGIKATSWQLLPSPASQAASTPMSAF